VSLLAVIALALLQWRLYERELVVSAGQSGTYREARFTRGQLLITIATGWNEDQRPRAGWTAIAGKEGFNLPDGRRLVSFGTSTMSSPVKTTGSLGVITPMNLSGMVVNVTTAPSTRSVQVTIAPVIELKGISSWTALRPPSLSSGGSGVGGADVQATLGGDFELTMVPKPKPPPPRASPWTITGTGTLRLAAYPYERYTVPLPLIAGVVLTPVWWKIVVVASRWRRRRGRVKRGLCVRCGYDLRGSPGGCPECGTPR